MVYTLPYIGFEAAVIVPKKAGMTAVGRNQLKRIVHEFLTQNKTHLSGRLAIVVHISALQATTPDLEADLIHHLQRLQVWNSP